MCELLSAWRYLQYEIEMLGALFLAGMYHIIIFVGLFTIVSTTFNQAHIRGDLHTGYSRRISAYV
jgi:hypothetical protein